MLTIVGKVLSKLYCSGIYKYTKFLSDDAMLKVLYALYLDRKLNLDNPTTFNEKIQWLKINNRDPMFTVMVDKYLAKDYVASIIGSEHIIPTIGHWNSSSDIDFDELPDKFVLKCNHNSGMGMYICKNKASLTNDDIIRIRKELDKGLNQDYYQINREWPYKNVKRCILAERFLESSEDDLPDYKFHCFNGKVRLILVCKDRFAKSGMTEDFFDESWHHLPFRRPSHKNSESQIERPHQLEEMIALAEKLAGSIPFIRVDFYNVDGKIYFGELTFFPASGFDSFSPDEWDTKLGEYLRLPRKHI